MRFRSTRRGNVRAIVEVEAMQWDGGYESQQQIVTWSEGAVSGWFDGFYFLAMGGDDGMSLRADPDDYVLKTARGFVPMRPAEFEETYERARD